MAVKKDYENIVESLLQWPRFRKAPGFDTVKGLMRALGYEDSIPMIHVVGTNGKGSVASMMASMLKSHGLTVGVFSSPHLVDIRERMQINGSLMSEDAFVKYYSQLEHAMQAHEEVGGDKATFFEIMFLMALIHFKTSGVDLMIMEAGIGGLNDTTNVLENRLLNVITSIGLDHVGILGDTIEAITKEKSGIIRPNSKTVAWVADPRVKAIIEGKAEECGAELVPIQGFDGDILERTKDVIDFSLYTKYYSYERMRMCVSADYQLNNAALAVAGVHALAPFLEIEPQKVIEGLEEFHWSGRMEYVYPWLLVDGGHNLSGIEAFVSHLNVYEDRVETDILFVCMGDKELDSMCRALLGIKNLGKVYVPRLPYARANDAQRVSETFSHMGFHDVAAVDDLFDFLDNRRSKAGARALLGAVGSLYLVGEIIKYRLKH